MIKSKKAAFTYLREMVIAVIILILLIAVFVKYTGIGFSDIGKQLALAGDCDKDGVINRLDACPCDKIDRGISANRGCPDGYKITGKQIGKEDASCLPSCTKIT